LKQMVHPRVHPALARLTLVSCNECIYIHVHYHLLDHACHSTYDNFFTETAIGNGVASTRTGSRAHGPGRGGGAGAGAGRDIGLARHIYLLLIPTVIDALLSFTTTHIVATGKGRADITRRTEAGPTVTIEAGATTVTTTEGGGTTGGEMVSGNLYEHPYCLLPGLSLNATTTLFQDQTPTTTVGGVGVVVVDGVGVAGAEGAVAEARTFNPGTGCKCTCARSCCSSRSRNTCCGSK
jgi:hypothetical protein